MTHADSTLDEIPASTWDAFAATVLIIDLPTGRVAIGPTSDTAGAFPADERVHVVTAHNPMGRHLRPAENERCHARLVERVRDLECKSFPAVGRSDDGDHQEESLALVGASEEQVLGLAREFEQAAFFRWTPQALEVVDQEGHVRSRRGWRILHTPQSAD